MSPKVTNKSPPTAFISFTVSSLTVMLPLTNKLSSSKFHLVPKGYKLAPCPSQPDLNIVPPCKPFLKSILPSAVSPYLFKKVFSVFKEVYNVPSEGCVVSVDLITGKEPELLATAST